MTSAPMLEVDLLLPDDPFEFGTVGTMTDYDVLTVPGRDGDNGLPGRDGTNLPPDGTGPATSPALDNDATTILWLPSTKVWTPRAFKTTPTMSDTDMLLAAITSGEVSIDLEDEHYDIEAWLDLGEARNWKGRGGVARGTNASATMFTCQDDSAGVRLPLVGGDCGGFMVHGNSLSLRGLVLGVPVDDTDVTHLAGAQSLLTDVTVQACAGDGIVAGASQNCHVRGLRTYNNGLDGARFENHLGGWVIEGYEATGNGVDGGEDTRWVDAGNSKFIGGFSEREAGATQPTVLIQGTVWNGPLEFEHHGTATGGTGGDTSHVIKHYANGAVVLRSPNCGLTTGEVAVEVCGRAANTGAGADTGPSLLVDGWPTVSGSGVSAFFMIDDKAVIYLNQAINNTAGGPGTANIPLLVGAANNPGNLTQIVRLNQSREINRPQNATDLVYGLLPVGDTVSRFTIDGNGTFRHGPGGSTAMDTFFGRGALAPDSNIGYGSASPIGTTQDMYAKRFRRYPRGDITLLADGTITVDAANELTFANLNGHNCTKFSISGTNAKVGQRVVVHLRNGSTPGTVVFGLAADSIDWIGNDAGVPTWPAVANFHMILKFEVTDAGRFQEVAGSRAASLAGALLAASNLSDVADAGTARYNLHVPILSSVQAVATSNVASLSGTTTIDGVALAAGDPVLLTAQTTGSQNGPWLVQSGAWTRPLDYPTAGSVKGRCIHVNGGSTANAGSMWVLKTTTTVTIDTTATTWAQANSGAYLATAVLAALSTGVLKSTTGTGALSIATAADIPTAAPGSTGPLSATSGPAVKPVNFQAPSGWFVLPCGICTSSATAWTTANKGIATWCAIDLEPGKTYNLLGVRVASTAQVGGTTTTTLGLYGDLDGIPDLAGGILASGTVTLTATGNRTCSISYTPTKVRHWVACLYVETVAPSTYPSVHQISVGLMVSTATIGSNARGYFASSLAALPTTAITLSDQTTPVVVAVGAA